MDDAGGGRRGTRAQTTDELRAALERGWGIAPDAPMRDLGGSSNLNLAVEHGSGTLVARVYRPSVSVDRLRDIQRARTLLADAGLPCLAPITASDGAPFVAIDDRLIEVEPYVEHDGKMDSWKRCEAGLRSLGAMHTLLRAFEPSDASRAPRFVNYIAPDATLEATARGVARIRAWAAPPDESRLADDAEALAAAVSDAQERGGYAPLPRQLVHGDFWDNNVLFLGEEAALIHDFDHMGVRARIEDAALTCYYMNCEPAPDSGVEQRRARIRRLVDAYDICLDPRLSAGERRALPVALARQPLWSIGGWVAELDDPSAARAHAAGMADAVGFALGIMRNLRQWEDALA